MAIWPVTLPQFPLVAGNQEQLSSNYIRTEMETGPAKIRKRGSSSPRRVSYQFNLTSTQLATLITFYDDSGAEWFEFDHPVTSATHRWRFTEPPRYQQSGPDTYVALLPLEVEPWPVP